MFVAYYFTRLVVGIMGNDLYGFFSSFRLYNRSVFVAYCLLDRFSIRGNDLYGFFFFIC